MLHIGNLEQLQLLNLLERIQSHHKTGKIIVTFGEMQEELYIEQGRVVAVSSPDDKEPLLRRLIHSEVVSPSDLQQIPANIGQIISQSSSVSGKRYSDGQVAKVLLKLGIVSSEQLTIWVQQENTQALQKLLKQSTGQVYFEEGVQLPPDHLCAFLETNVSPMPVNYHAPSRQSNTVRETTEVPFTPPTVDTVAPMTPFPGIVKKTWASEETLVPVAPSGFVSSPWSIGRNFTLPTVQAVQSVIQRTAAAIRPYFPIDNTLTERVPTDRKSTRLNSSHYSRSRMPSSA